MDNTGESIDWNWDIIPEITKLPPPYSVSYVQTCRLSIKLLDIIKDNRSASWKIQDYDTLVKFIENISVLNMNKKINLI